MSRRYGRLQLGLAALGRINANSKVPPNTRVCGLPWGVFAITLDQRVVYWLPWGVFAITLDQRVVYWGRGTRELLGYAPSAVVGCTWYVQARMALRCRVF